MQIFSFCLVRAKTPKLLPYLYLQRSLDWTWSRPEAPSSAKTRTHFRYGGESCKPVWPCERMVKSPFKVSSSSVWTDYWVRKWHQQLAIAVFSPFPSPFLFLLANSPKAVACKFQFLTNAFSLGLGFSYLDPVFNKRERVCFGLTFSIPAFVSAIPFTFPTWIQWSQF